MKLKELLDIILKISIEKKYSTPYICGGLPRDKVANKLDLISDIDITTGDESINPLFDNVVKSLSNNYNIPNINEQLLINNIKNPSNLQKEIYSRDFTCNALMLSFDLKEVLDITNKGISDIKSKLIRTCLSPDITLTTNKNRAIRAIYLSSKLNFELDDKLASFIKENPSIIKFAIPETLIKKTNDSFIINPRKTISTLNKLDLWKVIPITDIVKKYMVNFKKSSSLDQNLDISPITEDTETMHTSNLFGGMYDNVYSHNDIENKGVDKLNFGRNLDEDEDIGLKTNITIDPTESDVLTANKVKF